MNLHIFKSLVCLILVMFFIESSSAQNSVPMNGSKLEDTKTSTEKTKNLPLKYKNDESGIEISTYMQIKYIYEEVENGKKQSVTGDSAVKEAAGFSINRARISLAGRYFFLNKTAFFSGKISIMLETGNVGMLDCYSYLSFLNKGIQIWIGQMKIPSTYEISTSSSKLDFTTRSTFSSQICNWSLSKSISSVSPFTSVETYMRDLGIALKGDIYGFEYFFMIGNGLGANLFVGGPENRQFVYANKIGAHFYGIRATYDIIKTLKDLNIIKPGYFPLNSFRIGGHYNWNKHENILYNDKNTVLDIKRISWSCDAQLIIDFPSKVFSSLRIHGMYGQGQIDDDIDYNNKYDYKYSGWEIKTIIVILQNYLETGFRYDSYTYENAIFAGEETQYSYTIGLTYMFREFVKIQLNYRWKFITSELNIDIDDNILTVMAQFKY